MAKRLAERRQALKAELDSKLQSRYTLRQNGLYNEAEALTEQIADLEDEVKKIDLKTSRQLART